MKRNFSSMLSLLLIGIILLALPSILHAQPIDPGVDPAPIDGGVSIVAAACAGYLARRKKDRNNS